MRRITALVVLVVSLVLITSAQEPAPPQAKPTPPPDAQTPASPPSPADAAAGQPVFRAGINFVRVDVIVTDKQGNPLTDLTQADFEVFEDGKPQTVETFKLVKVEMTAPGYTSRTIRTREDEEVAASDESARIFVFFLDDYNVRLGNSMAARKPVADFIRTQLSPNDLVAVMYPLTPLDAVVLTRNHEGVVRVIERFEGRKFRYEPRNDIEQRYAQQPTEIVERIRRQVSLSALKALSVKLGALREGRKAIILLSEGYTAMLPPQMRDAMAGFTGLGNPAAGNPLAGENNLAEERARNMAEFDLQSELQNVFDAANRSNTAIYAVDPRGLSTGEFDIQDNIGPRLSQDALRSTMATLQVLAENTDGRAIVNRNDLAKGMEQIVRDSSAYYLVGYSSTQAPQDGKFHPIRVRIKRPGVQVRARKGYWALSADETVRATAPAKAGPPPAVTRAIAGITPASNRRFVRTWLGTEPGQDGRTKVTFVWEPIPAAPGMKREEARQVSLVAASPGGEEFFSGPVGDVAASPKGASVSFDVKPGRVRLRLAVEGNATTPLDSEDRELTVPDLTSSDLRLATPRVYVARTAREFQQLKADPAPIPTALREFRRTDRLVVRVNAFGKSEGAPTLTAKLLNKQGQKMTDLPVTAPAAPADPSQVDLPLSSLAAGEYLLELSAASDGQPPATELVAFRVTG
ncbi:MAG TPA: VWA domain-containing protein [Vicinamibacterales bacterium]|nr:VWA domain-containing protein [Vicinamibacterales bacterium]